ncbi:DUF3284 domain-containing protein [Aerococcaceae bacterium DSM 111021]|nr:DUF3284 domain-containing protein [Aerococcaceae bacterium DSM 111021]
MEMTKVYDARADDFFHLLRNSFKADYQSNTKKLIDVKDIKPGLKYKKSFGKDSKQAVLIEVEEMKFPLHYRVKLSSNRGDNIIEYLVESQKEDEIEVTYREEYVNTDFFTKWNNKILYPLFRKKFEKRMEAQVDNLIRHSKVRKEN